MFIHLILFSLGRIQFPHFCEITGLNPSLAVRIILKPLHEWEFLFCIDLKIITINVPSAHNSLLVCKCFTAGGDWAPNTWNNWPYKDCYVSQGKCGTPPHWQIECRLDAHSSDTQKHLQEQNHMQHWDALFWHTNITDRITFHSQNGGGILCNIAVLRCYRAILSRTMWHICVQNEETILKEITTLQIQNVFPSMRGKHIRITLKMEAQDIQVMNWSKT